MSLINQLESLGPAKKIAAIIRHGDRNAIPEGEFGNDILLNETGINNSISLGKSLQNFEIARIVTSPVMRCIQTAECIAEGYGRKVEITTSACLGDPGLHISDAELAGKYFLEVGFKQMYLEYMNGSAVPGLCDRNLFIQQFESFVKEHCTDDGITLMVTHDSFIAMAEYILHNKCYTGLNWIKYLSGFTIHR